MLCLPDQQLLSDYDHRTGHIRCSLLLPTHLFGRRFLFEERKEPFQKRLQYEVESRRVGQHRSLCRSDFDPADDRAHYKDLDGLTLDQDEIQAHGDANLL